MSQNPQFPSNLAFYTIGVFFILLGVAFFLVPILARAGPLSNIKIPWIILYVYNKDGFYFATSPLLIIISLIGLLFVLLRR